MNERKAISQRGKTRYLSRQKTEVPSATYLKKKKRRRMKGSYFLTPWSNRPSRLSPFPVLLIILKIIIATKMKSRRKLMNMARFKKLHKMI